MTSSLGLRRALRRSFINRAKVVLLSRFCLYPVLATHIYFYSATNFYKNLILIAVVMLFALFAYKHRANLKFGRWLHFISLLLDLIISTYFICITGYFNSPLLIMHPFFMGIFILLFHNPFIVIFPLIQLPIIAFFQTFFQNNLSLFTLLLNVVLFFFLDTFFIFLIHLAFSQEQGLTFSLLDNEQKLRYKAIKNERKRISAEFHDGVGGSLTSIIMQCDYLFGILNQQDFKNEINEIKNTAYEALLDMRRFLSISAGDFDINEQMGTLVENFKQRHFLNIVNGNLTPLKKLSNEQQFACCRITQEALNNVLKHSKADYIYINAFKNQKVIGLIIRDNGVGFVHKGEKANHFGLQNMKMRAKKVGGKFILSSTPNKGTHIEILFS